MLRGGVGLRDGLEASSVLRWEAESERLIDRHGCSDDLRNDVGAVEASPHIAGGIDRDGTLSVDATADGFGVPGVHGGDRDTGPAELGDAGRAQVGSPDVLCAIERDADGLVDAAARGDGTDAAAREEIVDGVAGGAGDVDTGGRQLQWNRRGVLPATA